MRMRRLGFLVLGVLMMVGGAAVASAQSLDPLAGTQWQLVSMGAADDPASLLPESVITLQFDAENRAGGRGGCNTYGGAYAVDGSAILFSEVVSTLMACGGDDLMDQEQVYFAALAAATSYTMSDETLIIQYGDDQQLVFMSLDSLAGTQWQLVSYGTADAPTPVIADSIITLAFDEENGIIGTGGCNRYFGTTMIEGETIGFAGVASTEMACMDEGIMEQETAYYDALAGASAYRVSGDELIIEYEEGQLVFMRVYSLIDTQWQLVSSAGTPVLTGSTITLAFSADNAITGAGGCNSYGGTYTSENGSISFSGIFSTRRACAQEGVMQQEFAYFTALESAVAYEVSADELIITDGEGQQWVFVPLAAVESV